VPAPAVIPAPIAYTKVAAVKTLVVEIQATPSWSALVACTDSCEALQPDATVCR